MKISILTENLKRAIGIVGRGVSSKPQLPILSGLLIKVVENEISFLSTDLEMGYWVRGEGKVEEEGELVVPAKLLVDLVGGLPAGTVKLSSENGVLSVVCGSVRSKIVGQGGEDFPSVPKLKNQDLVIKGGDFCEKVDRVCASSSRDDIRPVLSGVLWVISSGKVDLVATDGYRLAVDVLEGVSGKGKDDLKFILPAKSLIEVSRVVNEFGVDEVLVEFDKENQQVVFSVGGVEISTRLIAGEFPPYQQIMPNTYKTRMELERNVLLDAVKRASLFAKDNANIVKIEVGDNMLSVTAESSQVGSNVTEVEALVEGEKLVVAFNARYLVDYLSIGGGENLVWETEGELKPSVFRLKGKDEEVDSWVQVVMPVRVQG